jgi:hypothetical protein
VREGDRIRIAVEHDALYVLTRGAKEHRIELLKTERSDLFGRQNSGSFQRRSA